MTINNVLERKMLLSMKLAKLRRAHGWDQKQLADITGINNTALSAYERNRRAITVKDLSTLARLYCMTLDEITRGTEYDMRPDTPVIGDV